MIDLKINEIIDVAINQKLLDSFCSSFGIAAAIIDLEGDIIIGSNWQKICTDFHRKNSLACEKCIESDTKLSRFIEQGKNYSLYRCRNGLIDAASPIVVHGSHIANAFVGQFLFDSPDVAFFKQQAKKYGFHEEEYLMALAEVPIIEEKKVLLVLNFLTTYSETLADMALKKEAQLNSEKQLRKAAQEISSFKSAKKAIEADRKRLLSILDGIDDVIYVADPETFELMHVNKAFKQNWGNDVVGKKCYNILQDRDAPCPFCTNSLIFGEYLGRPYIWEFRNEINKRWYRCSDKAIRWVNGRMVRFEIAADITQLKVLEDELKNKNQQLELSNRELEQFAYVASHDLQEPLRMVASYTELLHEKYRERLDLKADKYIAYIVEGAKRMQQLINDLLMLSRVNTRDKPFKPTDCNELVKNVLHGIDSAIKEKKAQVEVGALPTVMGNEIQLIQLFQNLIINAIKFHGAAPPHVKISVKHENQKWIFSVQDNGIGIDPKFFDRIFVIFQRLHERGAYQGTGIGLAISKKIVERHGGKIWVESTPGKGSTFYFSLTEGI